MATRKEKREREKDTNYFFEFTKIQKHFFKDMKKQLKNVKDPRHQSYVTYESNIILFLMILKNAVIWRACEACLISSTKTNA